MTFILFFVLHAVAFCADNNLASGGDTDTSKLAHILGPAFLGTVDQWEKGTDDYFRPKVKLAKDFVDPWVDTVWDCLEQIDRPVWNQRWYHDKAKVMEAVDIAFKDVDLAEKERMLPHIKIFIANAILDTRSALRAMGKKNREERPEKKEMQKYIYEEVYSHSKLQAPERKEEDLSWMPKKASLTKQGEIAIEKGAGDFCFLGSQEDLILWLRYCLNHPATKTYDMKDNNNRDGNLELHFALVEKILCVKRIHDAGNEYKYMRTANSYFPLEGFVWGLPDGTMICTMPNDPTDSFAMGTHYSGFMGLSGNSQHDSIHGHNTSNVAEIFNAVFEGNNGEKDAFKVMLNVFQENRKKLPVTTPRAALTLYQFRGLHDDMGLPFHGQEQERVLSALKAMFQTERGWAEVNFEPMMQSLDLNSGVDWDKVDVQRWRDAEYTPILAEIAQRIHFRNPPKVTASQLLEGLGKVCSDVSVPLEAKDVKKEDLTIYTVEKKSKWITVFYDQVHKQLTVCLPNGSQQYDAIERSMLQAHITYITDVLTGKYDVEGPDQYRRLVDTWWSYIGVLFEHTGSWWHKVIYDFIITAAKEREEAKEPLPCCDRHG